MKNDKTKNKYNIFSYIQKLTLDRDLKLMCPIVLYKQAAIARGV